MKNLTSEKVKILHAMDNCLRYEILELLEEGEKQVKTIAEKLGARDSTVSQHLSLLRKDGIVEFRRDAQNIFYRIAHPLVFAILGVLRNV